MADLKKISCPSCDQKYRLPDSVDDRKLVCRECQCAFSVPGKGGTVANDESSAALNGGVFDSLDVDDLLNAPSSGLSQRRPKQIPTRDDGSSTVADKGPRQPELSGAGSAAEKQPQPQTSQRHSAGPVDPQTTLPVTVFDSRSKKAKRKNRKRKKAKREQSPVVDAPDTSATEDAQTARYQEKQNSVDAIDPEEQAVFDYAREVNGRKNAIAVCIALAIAISCGYYFAVEELDRLRVPLTQQERAVLEDQGFRLKAAPAGMAGQFAALPDDVLRVGVVPGVRLDRFGQPQRVRRDDELAPKFDPNAAFGDVNDQRKPPKKIRSVDFDTRVAADERAESLTLGEGKVRGAAVAVSPRNIVYLPEENGIAAYDLMSRKRVDFKSFDRFVGRSDQVSVLGTTPSGRFLFAGFSSGRLKSFQIDSKGRFFETRKLVLEHFLPIKRIAVSLDSQWVATVDTESKVALRSVRTGKTKWVKEIENSQEKRGGEECLDLAFSADDQQLFAAMTGSDVILDAQLGTTLQRKERAPRKAAVLSARQRSSVGCTDTEVAAFALDGDSELWKKSIRRTRFPVVKLDAVDDAGIFFDGGGSLIRFDLKTGGLIGRLPSANQQIQQPGAIPIVSADGQHLLFASRRRVKGKLPILRIDRRETDSDQLSRLPPTLELPRRDVEEVRNNKDLGLAKKIVKVALPDFGRKISALTLNDDGLLFFSNESGGLYVYDWTNGFVLDEVAIESNESIAALAICGKWLAVGHQRGGIMLYEIHESGSLRLHGSVFGHDKAVVGIESMPLVNETERDAGTANSIASLSKDGRLRVWEIPTFGNLMNVEALREPPKGLVVVDDTTILVASASRLATVNPKTQNVSVAVGRRVGPRVAVSADGKRLAFVKGKSITIAKAKTGVTEEPFAFEENPIAVQFTPDSKFLLVGFSKRFALVNFRSGKTVETVDVEVRSLGGLEALFAISPKRTLMASVSKQGQEIVIVPAEK